MKLSVTQENLSKALGVVGRVASTKTSLPILGNILLRAEKNRLLLAATNLEIAITEHIGAKVVQEGSLTIPARLLTDFIANLPHDNVELWTDGTKLHIEASSHKSIINGIATDDFPELPTITNETTFRVAASVLKRAITQTVLCASNDDTRPVLTAVYMHTVEGRLYMAATDGYRLAERELAELEESISALVPASTLQDVVRVMPDDCDEVTVLASDTQVRFLLGDIEVTSRLIDGSFPDYRQLIPKTTDNSFVIEKDAFSRITKIASLFARESGGSVTLQTNVTKQQVSIHSIASQMGENTSDAAATVEGEGSVTLNSRYLMDALGCFDVPKLGFHFSGKVAPCVLRGDGQSSDYLHVIMPLKS
jgi:DNA polymerase-3 subunit beta